MNSTKKNAVLTWNIAAIYSHLVRPASGGACGRLFYFHRECGDSNESQLGPPDLKTAAQRCTVHAGGAAGPPAKSCRHLGVPLPAHRKEKRTRGASLWNANAATLAGVVPPAHRVPEAEGRNLITAFFCLWGGLALTFR